MKNNFMFPVQNYTKCFVGVMEPVITKQKDYMPPIISKGYNHFLGIQQTQKRKGRNHNVKKPISCRLNQNIDHNDKEFLEQPHMNLHRQG